MTVRNWEPYWYVLHMFDDLSGGGEFTLAHLWASDSSSWSFWLNRPAPCGQVICSTHGSGWPYGPVICITSRSVLPAFRGPATWKCLVQYFKTYGQDKVLFGTNFPQLSWEKFVQQVQAMNLPEEIQTKFLGGNARLSSPSNG